MENNYNKVFRNAKIDTVHAHAMVYIKHVVKDDSRTDRDKFVEIHKIINQAVENLKED
ncbi:hypothetical protein Q7A53_05230 [Halobacillus rhizosphaerae]|uniref:hypothetical protein n=1 Tax=Halobacillus rhizosphaerae TaxID=3064889 RepID=UPI00398BB86C